MGLYEGNGPYTGGATSLPANPAATVGVILAWLLQLAG